MHWRVEMRPNSLGHLIAALKIMPIAVLLLHGFVLKVAASDVLDAQRSVFLEAEAALKSGKQPRYQKLYQQLADYPLQPYLDFKHAAGRLKSLTPAQVQALLVRLEATPMAARLRNRWLVQLAGNREWRKFLAFHTPVRDVEVRCHYAQALLRTGKQKSAAAQAQALWRHGSSRPRACDAVFKTLLSTGALTNEDIWIRFNLAVRAGNTRLAQYLTKRLPAARQAQAARWLALRAQPARVAELQPAADLPDQTLTRYALRRLALADSDAATALWMKLRQRSGYGVPTRTANDGHIGLGLALDHDARAFGWLASLPDAVSDSLREWRVRSAIRSSNWAGVQASIARLTPAQQRTHRWRYWQARADIALGRRNEGQKQLANLATARDYHAFLAADRMDLAYSLNHRPARVKRTVSATVSGAPALLRIRELLILDRLNAARSEWNLWLDGRTPQQVSVAAHLVSEWQWPTAAIIGLARVKRFGDLKLRFPVKYRAQVERNAAKLALAPSWIMAVVRQESAFASNARSRVGARGLMQIMPATGKQLARGLGLRLPRADSLLEPSLNLLFGSNYLAQLKQQFGGQIALATAAYNAGPHRVKRWLPDAALAADQWIETIPFKETRRYVQRVLEYDIIYRARLGLPMGRLSERLPDVNRASAEVSDRL
jgi:soluble lytic murein transglycosylase